MSGRAAITVQRSREDLSLFELGSLAMTDPTGRGDFHGDVDAVREANMLDPQAKIHNGTRAVTPATAERIMR